MKPLKVGVFDSGVGGITVLTELRQRFPFFNYIYLGDTANVPYGPKSPRQIQKLSIECAKTLKKKKIDILVVACNTASSWALPSIQKVMGKTPVIGVVEPGVDAALTAWNDLEKDLTPIVVLATRATVLSHAYGKILKVKLKLHSFSAIPVIEQACPILVPLIEEGWIDHSILHQTIREYVHSYQKEFKTGVALLGCTHYPWIHSAFQKALPKWTVVNSASAVADTLAKNFFGPYLTQLKFDRRGSIEWLFTDPDAVPAFAQQLMR